METSGVVLNTPGVILPVVNYSDHSDILLNILVRVGLKHLYFHFYKPYYNLINTKEGLYLLAQIYRVSFKYVTPLNLTQFILEYDMQYKTNILSFK